MTDVPKVNVEPEMLKKPTRQELRDSVFSSANAVIKTERFDFNGITIELKQPSVAQIAQLQNNDKNFVVQVLIHFGYIPDTFETIFEDADYDSLLAMPANDSFNRLTAAVNKLFNSEVDDKVKK